MKTKTLIICLALFVSLCSCHKSTVNTRGSWTFKNVNYPCSGNTPYSTISTFSAMNVNGTNSGVLAFTFFGTVPTTSGSYRVTSFGSATGDVEVDFTPGGTEYSATGGNGTNQHVTVTVSNGKLSIQGSSIELYDPQNPSDSSALSVDVHEL